MIINLLVYKYYIPKFRHYNCACQNIFVKKNDKIEKTMIIVEYTENYDQNIWRK